MLWEQRSGLGALKAKLIDVKSTDEAVDKFLDSTVHKPVGGQVSDQQECEANDVEAQCLPGLCKDHPLWPRSSQFVKMFHSQLESHNIKAGSLVIITMEDFPLIVSFFTGVTLKKPLLQTAVLARVEDDKVSFVQEEGHPQSLPTVTTTFHIFQDILAQTSATLDEVKVEHWSFSPALVGEYDLVVNAESVLSSFSVNYAKAPSQKKTAVRLPFGLTGISRKRKATPITSSKGSKGSKNQKVESSVNANAVNNEEDCSSCSGSETGQPNDVVAENENNQDQCDDDDNDDIEPISNTMAKAVRESHCVAQEVQKADEEREVFAAECEKSSTVGKSGSFFSKKLGLGEASLAPTGRAKCRSCNQLILKGSVRFEWSWNLLRPNSWSHPACIPTLAREHGLKDDTVEQLNKVICGSGSADDPIQLEATRILSVIS